MKIPTIRTFALAAVTTLTGAALASSHMDAPLITLDPSANTTDVYAFVADISGVKTLVTALGVYPHQEPGVGRTNTTSTTACPTRSTSPPVPT